MSPKRELSFRFFGRNYSTKLKINQVLIIISSLSHASLPRKHRCIFRVGTNFENHFHESAAYLMCGKEMRLSNARTSRSSMRSKREPSKKLPPSNASVWNAAAIEKPEASRGVKTRAGRAISLVHIVYYELLHRRSGRRYIVSYFYFFFSGCCNSRACFSQNKKRRGGVEEKRPTYLHTYWYTHVVAPTHGTPRTNS